MADKTNQQQGQGEGAGAGGTSGQGENTGAGGAGGQGGVTWERWLEGQEEGVRTLFDEHVAGLRSALSAEREQRRQFERELREAAGQLEQGSEARQRLESMANEVDESERRATFYEEAHAAGVTNLRLAWLAVRADETLADRRGNVNLQVMKERYPELFGGGPGRAAAGNAGSGTGQEPPAAGGMNAFIRRSAGRGG